MYVEGHPSPKQTEKPKLHTLHSVFSPFGKRTISFRIAWILAHRFSVSVSHHNYKSILGNKKLFIRNLTVFHSFNSGWHSSRAEILEVACLLYSATAIQRQNSGPHFVLWSWEQQHRLPIRKAWKPPWILSDMPQNYHHLLQKIPVPLQLTGCTEKADWVRRRISKTNLCRQVPCEYIPSRNRRQLA